MYQRGTIRNRAAKQQIIDFSGIVINGTGTPTDIDGIIEFKDVAFVFMEFKFGDAEMPFGQKLALTRLTDACQKSGKHAVLLVCQHDIANAAEDIDAATAKVRELYFRGKWYPGERSVKEVIDSFLEFVRGGEYSC